MRSSPQEGPELSSSLPTSHAEEVAACWVMGRTGRSVEALAEARRLLALAEQGQDMVAMATCHGHIAWFNMQLGYADKGLDSAITAKKLWAQSGNSSGEAQAISIYSWLLVDLGLVDEAFSEACRALELAEIEGEPSVVASAVNAKAIALIFGHQQRLAHPLLKRALTLSRSINDMSAEALYLVDLAFSQAFLAEDCDNAGDQAEGARLRQEARASNDLAISVAEACGDKWVLRIALCNGAEYHGEVGHTDLGMSYLARWRDVDGELGPREQIHYLYTLGELLTHADRLPEALECCEAAVAMAQASKIPDHQANTLRRLSAVHEKLGNFEIALARHKEFHTAYLAQIGEVTRRRAQLIEMQLENQKLLARAATLEEQASHDALTGLLNRRSFDGALAELGKRQFCLAIVDLDHFKLINDQHSHLAGDAVLRRVAETLGGLGWPMQAYRLGGEEFALLFVDTEIAAAAVMSENVRDMLARIEWSEVVPGLRVTASIGLAFAEKGMTMSELMATADRRLYRAKAQGRNRVVFVDGPIVEMRAVADK